MFFFCWFLKRGKPLSSPPAPYAFPPVWHNVERMTGITFTHSIGYKQPLCLAQSEDDNEPCERTACPQSETHIPLFSDLSVANHVYSQGQPISTKFKSQTQYEVPRFGYRKYLLLPQLRSLQVLSEQGHAGKGLFQEILQAGLWTTCAQREGQ